MSTCLTVQDAFSQMNAKCAFVCSFKNDHFPGSTGEDISTGSQREHKLAHNRGLPIARNQQTSIE